MLCNCYCFDPLFGGCGCRLTSMSKFIWVTWYEHDCEWITNFCDEMHTVRAKVPVEELERWRVEWWA